MQTIEVRLLEAAEFIIGYLDATPDIDEDVAARLVQLHEHLNGAIARLTEAGE